MNHIARRLTLDEVAMLTHRGPCECFFGDASAIFSVTDGDSSVHDANLVILSALSNHQRTARVAGIGRRLPVVGSVHANDPWVSLTAKTVFEQV